MAVECGCNVYLPLRPFHVRIVVDSDSWLVRFLLFH